MRTQKTAWTTTRCSLFDPRAHKFSHPPFFFARLVRQDMLEADRPVQNNRKRPTFIKFDQRYQGVHGQIQAFVPSCTRTIGTLQSELPFRNPSLLYSHIMPGFSAGQKRSKLVSRRLWCMHLLMIKMKACASWKRYNVITFCSSIWYASLEIEQLRIHCKSV